MPATSSNSTARRYTRSSSFQMALLFTALCGSAGVSLGWFSHYFSPGRLLQHNLPLLELQIQSARLWEDPALMGRALQGEGRDFALLSPAGATLAGGLPTPIADPPEPGQPRLRDLEGRTFALAAHDFADGRRLLVGLDLSDSAADYAFMRRLSLVSLVVVLVVILTSYLISTFVVTRTNLIARTAQSIMDTGDLSRRIDIDSRWDDLSFMAGVLNRFIGRIEQLMQGIRQVADNIAHDLRTPLTHMRNKLEAMKKQENMGGDEVALAHLDRLIEESDQLLRTFNAILQISRIETGRQHSVFRNVDLWELARDVLELYEPLAEQQGLRLTATLDRAACRGDRDLLFQACANLLDNAIKFTPPGGRVAVELQQHKAGAELSVSDSGPGIPAAERDKVFERFYRGEGSRNTPGNGLGLSLVAAVVELHGGGISLAQGTPGLRVTVALPAVNNL